MRVSGKSSEIRQEKIKGVTQAEKQFRHTAALYCVHTPLFPLSADQSANKQVGYLVSWAKAHSSRKENVASNRCYNHIKKSQVYATLPTPKNAARSQAIAQSISIKKKIVKTPPGFHSCPWMLERPQFPPREGPQMHETALTGPLDKQVSMRENRA